MTFQPIPGVLVLGLGHKARHGKDTAAQAMLASAPLDVVRIGFADALYDYCRVEHDMTEKNPALLQRIGVQMRLRDPQTWINAVYWKIVDKKPKVVVIPDVRFENEAQFVRGLGGFLIKVERRNADDSVFQTDDRDPRYISEIELDGFAWDLTITNRDVMTTCRNAVVAMNFFKEKHREHSQ